MTYQNNSTLSPEILEEISEQGLDYIPELIRVLVNEAMKQERQKYLHADPYQMLEERQGHANGYKGKTVKMRMGEITFAIPQVREGGSTRKHWRKGSTILEQLSGTTIPATTVSEVIKQMDEGLEKWRNSPLGEVVYLFLDARYEKYVRMDTSVMLEYSLQLV
jgi:transposase-like protein